MTAGTPEQRCAILGVPTEPLEACYPVHRQKPGTCEPVWTRLKAGVMERPVGRMVAIASDPGGFKCEVTWRVIRKTELTLVNHI